MKQGFKLLTVLLLTLLLTASATAQINWLKQDGNVKYLAWDNGTKSKTIYNGSSASFATGYFGSTIGKTVTLTVTLNSKNDGKIVSTIVSKNVNVANTLGYEVITVLPEHYKNKAGEYIMVIKLKDANSELVDSSLYLEVKPNYITEIFPLPFPFPVNTAPVMDAIPDKEVLENSYLQFTVSATDAENDHLEYEAKVCWKVGNSCWWFNLDFVGASFNQNTNTFSWKPDYGFVDHPGLSRSIDFRFRAIDDENKKSDWEQITVTVKDVNQEPKFNFIGNKIVQEEQLLLFTVSAIDEDNDELTYSVLTGLPPGAGFDPEAQKFKWIPDDAQAGLYAVTFKVVDNFGGKDTEVVFITVTNVVKPQCDDKLDNDNDGKVDYPNDPGCTNKDDNNESDDPSVDIPECKDGIDNDSDGKIDFPKDAGCSNENDDNESDDPPENVSQCEDRIDNDGDGKIDYPTDLGCANKDDNNESDDPQPPVDVPECKDGIDNDSDGKIDFPKDAGCSNENDDNESDEPQPPVNIPECKDGMDNDLDGKIDYPNDKGCSSQDDDNESDDPPVHLPQCNDGKDNDSDGKVDYTSDPGCINKDDNDEYAEFPVETPKKLLPRTNIKFKSVVIGQAEAGDIMVVRSTIFNNGETDLKDVKLQATVYSLGAFGSTNDFNLTKGKGATKNIYVYLPEKMQPGWYLVKITAKNYHYNTPSYRLAYIDNRTFQ